MTADSVIALGSTPRRASALRRLPSIGSASLAVPALLMLIVLFLVPAVTLFSYSLLTQARDGSIGAPVTAAHFVHLFATPLYMRVLIVTLRISLWTSLLAMVLGFPAAIVIVRGHPAIGRLTTIIVIAPLVVSVVVRTYGWQLLLGNGPRGVVNWLLHAIGFGPAPLQLMYTETAVVLGSLHVFLPMMVLPLASSLARIPPALEEAARTLGAPAWRVFLRVTLPLCLPGLAAGLSLVFALTFSSFIVPAILGGNRAPMLGNLLEQQVVAVYDWPFAAAIAVIMVTVVFAVNGLALRLLESRTHRMPQAA